MPLQIDTRLNGDITILSCNGDIRLGEGTSLFRNTLREILKDGAKKIVIDLKAVNYLDSTGIGELVGGYTSAQSSGARIVMAQLPQKVHALLQITRLLSVFEIHDTEDAAVNSLS